MLQQAHKTDTQRYANCIAVSRRIRWEIEKDVFRGRTFEFHKKFLPDGLSKIQDLTFMNDSEKRLLSQIQGRTYANMFGLVERFICAKIMELSGDYVFGDQVALEALVRFSDEELKHQELFRRIDKMIGEKMPAGYQFLPQPNDVAAVVLDKSTWAVLALTCHIELFTQAHYKQSIEPDSNLSELYKDIFLFHWKEESQHAILDELEWIRENRKLTDEERGQAVQDLIDLVVAVDGILQVQSKADAEYFFRICNGNYNAEQRQAVEDKLLQAYRWQYIISGVQEPRFLNVLGSMINSSQHTKITQALSTLM
ncbi:MAG: hypothetical protein L0Z73_12830 [Gammaproteobacteria bacterium]|nr:hypothetical protein [Gammaproteobacteria bacterium]